MKRLFLTGISGVGKTSVANALRARGIAAVDLDSVPELCAFEHRETKQKFHPKIVEVTPGYFKEHQYVCDIEYLKQILLENQGKAVVVSGTTANQAEFFHLFDGVLLLRCSPENLLKRLRERSHTYAKTPDLQTMLVKGQSAFDSRQMELGAVPINANGSLTFVVEAIMAHLDRGSVPLAHRPVGD